MNDSQHEAIEKLREARDKILGQLSRIIVGQNEVIDELLISLFSRGHCLLEGVPGLAKTLMISTLSRSLNLSFSRIQFTPDLMPADITGRKSLKRTKRRAPANDASWKARYFRERHSGGRNQSNAAQDAGRAARSNAGATGDRGARTSIRLSDPFFVLATQNPIEQEGTYPLPEAQQDRFHVQDLCGLPQLRRRV